MQNFRTFDLAVTFYQLTRTLPLRGALKDQLDRAAASVALNLGEARGRQTKADQKRFFAIAFGSVRECQAILTLAQLKSSPAWSGLDTLAAHLYRLIERCGG